MGLASGLTCCLPRRRRPARPHEGPRHDVPWRQAAFTAIDLETTGLDLRRDHIVSIGLVRIEAEQHA